MQNPDIQVVLASESPRRRELLSQIGVRFEVVATGIPEEPGTRELAGDYAERLAAAKAVEGWRLSRERGLPEVPALGADTVVCMDGRLLGKPADEGECTEFLEALSGSWHEVMSAVAVAVGEDVETRVNVTRVWFRDLSRAEMRRYWQTGEPVDKAGGYAIQGIGALFVERIEGSYSGVVGLPLLETAELLAGHGVRIP